MFEKENKNENKKIIIPTTIALTLAAALTIYIATNQKPEIEPVTPVESSESQTIQVGDFTATEFPESLPVEAVSGVLGSLSAYVENMLNPDLTVAAFLSVSHQNQILRLNITDTGGEATLITADNADAFTAERNPLRSTRQLVNYAANSGHTINDLSITDEVSAAGVKDFSAYLDDGSLVAGTDGAPDYYALSDQARSEIIKYCSDMIAENRDTELYILSDDVIAFVMCERYSEESLLGSFSFLEKNSDGAYLLKTVIDFNC